MKNEGMIRNFVLGMVVLFTAIALFWFTFYFLTSTVVRNNVVSSAQMTSESIISRVEEELLDVENTAYALSDDTDIAKMLAAEDDMQFFDMGAAAKEESDRVLSVSRHVDTVILINSKGLAYRLKGRMSNTVIKRIGVMIERGDTGTLSVSTNDSAYVGICREVTYKGDMVGYVVLFLDITSIEAIINDYYNVDYLGIALLSNGKILCSNKDITELELNAIRTGSLFCNEKVIGLTDLNIMVYCQSDITRTLSGYFAIAMPATIFVLVASMYIFIQYWKTHFFNPIDSVISDTVSSDAPIELTGEDYFDRLVVHVNDMIQRIEDREHELSDSNLRLKEAELEKERTLISLLKKQISAHFTVNTLNAVRALIYKGENEKAAAICDELSCLLRYVNAGDEYISLMEEMYVIEQYVSIMQVRYPGRVELVSDIYDEYENIMVPRMLLQPVIENAILHGLSDRSGVITVSAEHDDRILTITLSDNGKGMSARQLERIRQNIAERKNEMGDDINHIALENIANRIRLVCGAEYGITIDSEPGSGTTVVYRLPVVSQV